MSAPAAQPEAVRYPPAKPDPLKQSKEEERRFERQYKIESKALGEGTYGAVYKAQCLHTQHTVAVKKVKMEGETEGLPSTAIREVAVLKRAKHPNIVRLLDTHCVPGKFFLVFEFVPVNLKQHMRRHDMNLSSSAVQSLQHQLMLGLEFCHTHRIIHRDLKPQNLLVDNPTPGGGGLLKIADLGMARTYKLPVPKFTHEVVTTWYRAPEILFGAKEYALPVDVWSAGCILGEMATGSPLFHGDSEIDTIFHIFRKLGTPSDDEWPGLSELPDFKATFPKWRRKPWEEIRGVASQLGLSGIQLLDKMLYYQPEKRISTKRALLHPYLAPESQSPGPTPASARTTALGSISELSRVSTRATMSISSNSLERA